MCIRDRICALSVLGAYLAQQFFGQRSYGEYTTVSLTGDVYKRQHQGSGGTYERARHEQTDPQGAAFTLAAPKWRGRALKHGQTQQITACCPRYRPCRKAGQQQERGDGIKQCPQCGDGHTRQSNGVGHAERIAAHGNGNRQRYQKTQHCRACHPYCPAKNAAGQQQSANEGAKGGTSALAVGAQVFFIKP